MKKRLLLISCCAALLLSGNVYATDMSEWAKAEYELASGAGLLSCKAVENSLKDNITREEFCELVVNLYKQLTDKELYTPESPFEDTESNAVAQAYALGIVSGKSETEFDPNGIVTREELAKLVINTLKAAEINVVTLRSEAEEYMAAFDDAEMISPWAYSEMAAALKYSLISGAEENLLSPEKGTSREQAIAVISRTYSQFANEKSAYIVPEFASLAENVAADVNSDIEIEKIDGAKKYFLIVKSADGENVKTFTSSKPVIKAVFDNIDENMKYTLTAGAEYESGEQSFSLPVDIINKHEAKVITKIKTDPATLSAKELRVFPDGIIFDTEEVAAEHMTNVTVDVWCVRENGEKYAAKKTLTVNKYLAEDVVKIFKKIFDDPSRFPIKSVGGYCWRTTAFGSVSQHSYGTCIDINPDENYYCYSEDGTAITGKGWEPYENIYSITPDGAVVAAFAEYGWIWGGSWNGTVKDYMHFSYLGK